VHNALGTALELQQEHAKAADEFREATRLSPEYLAAHFNLAGSLKGLGRYDEALASFDDAARLGVPSVETENSRATVLQLAGRLVEANAAYERALELKPDYAEAHNNLGQLRTEQGDFSAAVACFEQAVHLRPDLASLRHNLAMALLIVGDYARGWTEFESRWQVGESLPRPPREEWDGSPLAGRTILLYLEQGLGDTLQFIRYAPLVKARGGTVVLACPPQLAPLLSTCAGIDRLVHEKVPLSEIDVQAALLSLPRIFKTELTTVPADVPYLKADAELVERWRSRLERFKDFRVGICWQGNRSYRADATRSFSLAAFAPLAAIEGVRLFSLQKGFGSEQLSAVPFAVEDLGADLDEAGGTFSDTAAVIENLDLVISADTAIGHLAGALGAPVWVAQSFVPDWRWLLDRADSPWYPTLRLFRQTGFRQWSDVFERMAAELAATSKTPRR
jgi:hypothetical protein